jgi:hypothetical protein
VNALGEADALLLGDRRQDAKGKPERNRIGSFTPGLCTLSTLRALIPLG